MEFSLV